MERIATFNMSADMAALQSALSTGNLPAQLGEPMQALVHRAIAASSDRPVAIYLCSSDEHAGLRDHFAYLLVRMLSQHIPSTLLVDCDFLNVGLHGLVPESDALGFLDLLLYGSSLGVITQQTSGGVKTVGAGSFPVTKRMPFVMGAFEEAARRLTNHARCVVFVGPLFDDESNLHALIGAADMPLLLRESTHGHADAIDPIEERIAATWDLELSSVRLVSPASARPVDEVFTRVLGDDEEAPAAVDPRPPTPEPVGGLDATFAELADIAADEEEEPPPPPREPIQHVPAPDPSPPVLGQPDDSGETPGRRRQAHPVAVVVAVLAVLAAVWWITRDKGESGVAAGGERPAAQTSTQQPVRETPPPPAAASADTTPKVDTALNEVGNSEPAERPASRPASRPQAIEQVVDEPEYVDPADTRGGTGGTVLLNSHDIHVMDDLQANWPAHYFIHISSFRRSVEARDDVAFLESREFPVFIVFLDLDAKGKWYRVYAGPFVTREEARDVKKSLDDIPRVRFTRITKISG